MWPNKGTVLAVNVSKETKNSYPKVSRFTFSTKKETNGAKALGSRNSTATWKLTMTLNRAPTDSKFRLERTGIYAHRIARTSKVYASISFAKSNLTLLKCDPIYQKY